MAEVTVKDCVVVGFVADSFFTPSVCDVVFSTVGTKKDNIFVNQERSKVFHSICPD